MNHVEIQKQHAKLVNTTSISGKQRIQKIKQKVTNKHLLLKSTPNQVYKTCKESKCNEYEAKRISQERR